jgi:hypothetical protein
VISALINPWAKLKVVALVALVIFVSVFIYLSASSTIYDAASSCSDHPETWRCVVKFATGQPVGFLYVVVLVVVFALVRIEMSVYGEAFRGVVAVAVGMVPVAISYTIIAAKCTYAVLNGKLTQHSNLEQLAQAFPFVGILLLSALLGFLMPKDGDKYFAGAGILFGWLNVSALCHLITALG